MVEIPDDLHARGLSRRDARRGIVPPGKAVARGQKAVVSNRGKMLGHPVARQVTGGDKEIVPVPAEMTAFKARYDGGRKAGADWRYVQPVGIGEEVCL